MDGRHYTDYFNNQLKNQESFCLHLKSIGKFDIIENDQSNPMTIRLLLTKEALDNITRFINYQKQALVETKNLSFPFSSRNVSLDSMRSVSGSTQYFISVENNDCQNNTQNNIYIGSYNLNRYNSNKYKLCDTEFNLFVIQKYGFQFFTNYGSALDRIAYEIKLLYHENSIVFYSDLTNNSKVTVQNLISRGYSNLINITTSQDSNYLKNNLKYRHRYVHDGILKLHIDMQSGDIKIPDNPKDPNSFFTNNLDMYCTKIFKNLIKLINDIYGQMILDIV